MEYILDNAVSKRPGGKKPLIIVQARMGSTRLPGKIMKSLKGTPMVEVLLKRLFCISPQIPILLATTTLESDDDMVRYVENLGVSVFRGDEQNVLDRFYSAALQSDSDAIIRITADCPLVDPGIISKMTDVFYSLSVDLLSNVIHRTFPRGFDVEIFSQKALEKAFLRATSLYDQEHVTTYIKSHPELFSIASIIDNEDLSSWRLTVDTREDLF